MKRLCMGCMQEYDEQYDICPFCGYAHGTPPQEAYHMTPGTILNDKYIIGKVLGFGGFGITYIAYDKILEQRVAIKEYMPGEFSTRMPEQKTVTVFSGDREEQFREGLQKIELEAKKLSKFSSVPNIVHIYDCFQANNTVYIVMEYLDGETLKEKLNREGNMPVQEAFDIVMKVIAAMKKVHKEGIIHRDIAPDNIFVLKNGDIKVIDFGAARYATTKHSKSLSVIIKPGYAPEEQYRSRGDQGPHTDVYALAATFYKMITGITPEDAMERSVKDMLKRPSKLGIEISKPMDTAIMNALMVNIEDRTPTMDEFEEELNNAEVKERKKTAAKDRSGKIPLSVKIGILVGVAIVAVSTITVFSMNFAPKLISEAIFGEKEIPAPNLINQDFDNARENNIKYINVVDNGKKPSDDILLGKIITQDPAPGTTITTGSTIFVTISSGKEPMIIPNAVGMRIDEAQNIFKSMYKNVEVVASTDDMSAYPPGTVVSQSIEAYSGTVIPGDGDSIVLTYNANGFDLENYTVDKTSTTVPDEADVKNKDFWEIQKSYYDQNAIFLSPVYVLKDGDKYVLSSDEKKEVAGLSTDAEKGKILAIDTVDGKNIDKILQVYVYDGIIPFKVDDYRGSAFADVQSKFLTYGINVNVEYSYDPSVAKDSIIEQKYASGEALVQGMLLHEGDSVTLIVNTGEAPQDGSVPNTTQPQNNSSTKPTQNVTSTSKASQETVKESNTTRETQAATSAPTTAAPTQPPTTTAPPQTANPTQRETQATIAPDVVDDLVDQ